MREDIAFGIILLALALPFIICVINGVRDHKREQRKLLTCPHCGATYSQQCYQDNLAGPMGQSFVLKRYCRNGHSWTVKVVGANGERESMSEHLGGWAP